MPEPVTTSCNPKLKKSTIGSPSVDVKAFYLQKKSFEEDEDGKESSGRKESTSGAEAEEITFKRVRKSATKIQQSSGKKRKFKVAAMMSKETPKETYLSE